MRILIDPEYKMNGWFRWSFHLSPVNHLMKLENKKNYNRKILREKGSSFSGQNSKKKKKNCAKNNQMIYILNEAASSSMALLPLRRLEEEAPLFELLKWADISTPLWSQTTRSGGTLVSHSKTTRSPGGATIGWGERTKDTPDVIVTAAEAAAPTVTK